MHERSRRIAATLVLFLTNVFFLCMFFSAAGLELAALAGQVTGPTGVDPVHAALEFSARWRHGMTHGWPLYMPGFFLTAIATWYWTEGRSILRVMLRASALLAVAMLVALALTPIGSSMILRELNHETGLTVAGAAPWPTIAGWLAGCYTLFTWETFIAAGRCALNRRSFQPYIPAILLTLGLGIVRPMLVDDFVSLWSRRVTEGNLPAIVSLVLIPIVATSMLLIHMRQKHPDSKKC